MMLLIMMKPSVTAAALCLCGCLLCCGGGGQVEAAPAPSAPSRTDIVSESTEEAAVTYLHKTFYGNAEIIEKGTNAKLLIKEEIQRIGFNFNSIANRSVEDWEYIVRSLFMSYYLKQKSTSERVTHLLYRNLGIKADDKPISKDEHDAILNRVPAAVINRVDKWNQRPMTRQYEDMILIGSQKMIIADSGEHISAWSFTLERSIASKQIRNMMLGIHLTPESRQKTVGMTLEVKRARETVSSSIYKRLLTIGTVNVDPAVTTLSEELQVNIRSNIMPAIQGMLVQRDGEELELIFTVTCPLCGAGEPNVTYMVLDCKVRVAPDVQTADTELSREARSIGALKWPYDNSTAAEVFKNHAPGASFTKTQMCIIENVSRRYGQKSCCLMEFTYDMRHQSMVLTPKQLKISYCAGECHGQSQVHTPHSSLLQIVGHSQTTKLSHETKEDINLCCVANTYRDFQVLTISRPTAGSTKTSVQLKVIKDISAESCTCA